ncbi:transcriptional regulator RcsA [Nissabacter sp. SGAir0207]|uniref:transcriptional regulator RcsA n=1 Tax=Nissabacter sp. SGAir0207 TaxID=2126321 RepID=UPI0010CCDF49|nr:transcriptional regulator RcsA [Nissabacter sp. SGAir0207]QCR37243.1 transcriptional regulator RcsA [Nissabacter sp. SGAir0207]
MSAIIVDQCHFTRLALLTTLLEMSQPSQDVLAVKTLADLHDNMALVQPQVVFINEACFCRQPESATRLRQMIAAAPQVQFVIFIDREPLHYREFVAIGPNIVLLPKTARPHTLRPFLALACPEHAVAPPAAPLSLSASEHRVLAMWMAGQPTPAISARLNIHRKTVSLYKGNIKRKVGSQSKQVIHHVARLVEQLTNGIPIQPR